MMSDMPNVIYAYEEYTGFVNGCWLKECTELTASLNGVEKYHHDSILQAKDREIAELKEINSVLKWVDDLEVDENDIAPPHTPKKFREIIKEQQSRIATLEKQLQDQALTEKYVKETE